MTTELAYTYNDFGLPVKLTYTDVDGETRTVREETNLTYDGNGNILTEAVTEAYSGSTTKTRTYQYDLGNRLISAAYDGTTTTYTYDAVGNRLTRQEGTETAETYTYNYQNQLTRVQQGTAVTTYTYDARGNQTQQVQTGTGVTTTTNYGYDLANRLISSGISNNAVIPLSTSATYAYNAQGQRVTRVEDEVITHFYYTGSALLFTTVNEYVLQTQNILDPSGTIVASKRFEGQAETEQDPYADDYFFYRYDIRGSVTNIVDGTGAVVKSYDYDEFGVTTSTGDTFFNEVTFTGSVADASGLLYMNARYYNPTTARFLSQDTYTGSASDPWTQHLYVYCNNNPVNMIDPTGHVPVYTVAFAKEGGYGGRTGGTPKRIKREYSWSIPFDHSSLYSTEEAAVLAWAGEDKENVRSKEYMSWIIRLKGKNGSNAYIYTEILEGGRNNVIFPLITTFSSLKKEFEGADSFLSPQIVALVHSHPEPEKKKHNDFPSAEDCAVADALGVNVYVVPYTSCDTRLGNSIMIRVGDVESYYHSGINSAWYEEQVGAYTRAYDLLQIYRWLGGVK